MSITTRRLPFRVIEYTTQAPDRRAQNLEKLDPHGYGWQTEEFFSSQFIFNFPSTNYCSNPHYPQVLVLALDDGMCRITEIQILCHETKIPTRIQINIGSAPEAGTPITPDPFRLKTIGFLYLFHF